MRYRPFLHHAVGAKWPLTCTPLTKLRMLMMQNRPQDDVKVAVYTEQMSAPEQNIFQDAMGAVCLGLGLLLAMCVRMSF